MDEQTKQKVMVAVIAFNITAILHQVIFNGLLTGESSFLGVVVGVVLGLVAAGIAFGVMHVIQGKQ